MVAPGDQETIMHHVRSGPASSHRDGGRVEPELPGQGEVVRISVRQRWRGLPLAARCTLVVYAIGFAIGARKHVADLVSGGFGVYSGLGPVLVQAFFVSLAFIDPLVIVLVLLARPVGVWLGLVVMIGDLAANLSANWTMFEQDWAWLVRPTGLLLITAFSLFVFVTAIPLARILSGAPARSPAH